ncbi:hypothetical protein LTR85_011859 [Meristemomyces frigidus]|nr:hypothetical protein LTR85_011859 [Meristemomyces frigidus]
MARIPYAPLRQEDQGDNTLPLTEQSHEPQVPPASKHKATQSSGGLYFLGFFLASAIWSTAVIWLSLNAADGNAAPAWFYFYAFDWIASPVACIFCMIVIYAASDAKVWTWLMTLSAFAQGFALAIHVVLLIVYVLRFPHKEYPSTLVVWEAWGAWINVVMAVVMVLQDYEVEWASELFSSTEG